MFLTQCAKIVAPTGGPKDEQHPRIVTVEPPNKTVNFSSGKINITFDEFIQLKDLNSNLVISPPVEEKPEIIVKGKTLEIKLMSELKDSTTYNFYFGNSVQDYNEGNPIENFEYVLSTGDYIDSLALKGQVVNSFNLLPEEGVFVMLYREKGDSVPIKQLPDHISKTDAEGHFYINNISNNDFKLFALRDNNKNYLFDLTNEDIAFVDSLITFQLVTEIVLDTIYSPDSLQGTEHDSIAASDLFPLNPFSDSLVQNSDTTALGSLGKDSAVIIRERVYYPEPELTLHLFTEYHELQYLTSNTRNKRYKIELTFNKPVKDSMEFVLVDTAVADSWYMKESNQRNDSIIYWLTDSTLYNKENLNFALSYYKEDTNMVYQWSTDTLRLRYTEPKLAKNQEPDTSLKYQLNVKSRGTIDLNNSLNFLFETPVQDYDTSKINLFAVVDTLEFPVEFEITQDSLKMRKYLMHVDWSEDTIYRLEVFPNAITDIYETVNDTNIVEFKTQKLDHYGKVLANITGIDSAATPFQLITQLVIPSKDTETVYQQKIINKDQIVEFSYLPPKEFLFKVILDNNFNGKWDTGEYITHLQPEEVLYYKEKVKVRSNWDIEINFDVNK